MTLEAGGIYAASYSTLKSKDFGDDALEQLVLQFKINGGNVWVQGLVYGVRANNDEDDDQKVGLVYLEVANMDAVLNDLSF